MTQSPRVLRIGQIVPSSNTTMETEIPAMLRRRETIAPERFTFHSSRMRMKQVTAAELASMDRESDRCAQELSDARVDVLGYACLVAIMAQGLGYHGVLCVEFFVLKDGSLIVNEIAPRPHNSGHYTMDACLTSQFEQQARAMAGLPLGGTDLLAPAVMLNILGDIWYPSATGDAQREPDWAAALAVPTAKLHLYGKREARRGRKMGHVTIVAPTLQQAQADAARVAAALGMQAPE